MSFRDRSFAQRFQAMGDQAEGVFELVYPEGFVKFGLSRPPVNLSRVPAFVRYTPDYLTAKGLVEVQGFGNDRTFKMKLDKLQALCEWQKASGWRVDLFAYDSMADTFGWIRLDDLTKATRLAHERTFPEGKPYLAWPCQELPICDGWNDVIRSKS